MIHVVLCFTDLSGSYYKHAMVTALSILDNTKSHLCLHIVHDDTLNKKAATAFSNICSAFKQDICFHYAGEIPDSTEKNVIDKLSKGALYRTMLPDLTDAGKILYFDCDIVCLADVKDIFSLDISRNYLGAVAMKGEQATKWVKKLGLTCGVCINTGVLLMNLDKMRSEIPEYSEQIFDIVGSFPTKVGDQGAINILFDKTPEAYLFLPEDFNFRTEQADHSVRPLPDYCGKVLHFAGKKPWQVLTRPGFYYWKYYSRLFPDENVFERIEALEPYENDYLYSFILSDERRRRKIRRSYDMKEKGLWRALAERVFRQRG